MLDAGCGNGDRGLKIASELKASQITFLDNCPEFIFSNSLVDRKNVIIKDMSDTSLDFNRKFDIILCLNNVLGHVPTRNGRVTSLINFKKNLSEDGLIFIDVNNRHNLANYGLKNVLKNILNDLNPFKKNKGDFKVEAKDNLGSFATIGHLFTDREIRKAISEVNLEIVRKYVIDYDNGKIKKSSFNGQLLYILKRRESDK